MQLPTFSITARTVRFLMEIEALKERVRHSVSLFPAEISLLARHLSAEQIYHASVLDGGQLSLEQVAKVVDGDAALPASTAVYAEEIAAIRGYQKARAQVEQWVKEGVWMTESALQALHGLILSGGEVMAHSPYREEGLRVYDATARSAYMAPPPAMLPELMYEMVTDAQATREVPAPFRAAKMHYMLMSLQPFESHNQWIAFLAAHWMLAEEGYTLDGLVGLEPYYARDFMLYADVVGTRPSSSHYSARLRADITEWASYVGEMLALSFRHAWVKLETLGAAVVEKPRLFVVQNNPVNAAEPSMPASHFSAQVTEIFGPIEAVEHSEEGEAFASVDASEASDEDEAQDDFPEEAEQSETLEFYSARDVSRAPTMTRFASVPPVQLVIARNREEEVSENSADRELDVRQRKVMKLFDRQEIISAKQIRLLFKVKPRTASGICKDWVEQGFLDIEDPSNKTRSYRLGEAYRKASSPKENSVGAVEAATVRAASSPALPSLRRRPSSGRRVSLGDTAIRLRLRDS